MRKLDLGELLASFERAAFRLETLDRYTVPSEDAAFAAFKAGQPLERSIDRTPWLRIVHDATADGKRMSRVHLLSQPHSDYVEFELDAYAANVDAGEDIRIGGRARHLDLVGRGDFWIFDDRTVAVMRYDDDGRFLGAFDDSHNLAAYQRIRDRAVAVSVPYRDYMAGTAAVV